MKNIHLADSRTFGQPYCYQLINLLDQSSVTDMLTNRPLTKCLHTHIDCQLLTSIVFQIFRRKHECQQSNFLHKITHDI